MLSLAPFRYMSAFGSEESPIGKIEFGPIKVQGQTMFQANAFLKSSYQYSKQKTDYYSLADGSGTHRSPLQARYKAISEALERWALYHCCKHESPKEYGFDIDTTSTGMAAFPGLFKSQARSKALTEAAERFCLISWWSGRLPHRSLGQSENGINGIEISNPISQDKVVVLWKPNPQGFYTYGFSADKTVQSAVAAATIELDRSEKVLTKLYRENPGFCLDDLSIVPNFQERRVLYYSMAEGHEVFDRRLSSPVRNEIKPPIDPIIDAEIKGPWSLYATVWRVLFDMPTQKHMDENSYFFFW